MTDGDLRRDVCWYCGGQLVWQNDWSYTDFYDAEDEQDESRIVTILKCADCGAEVEYRSPREE